MKRRPWGLYPALCSPSACLAFWSLKLLDWRLLCQCLLYSSFGAYYLFSFACGWLEIRKLVAFEHHRAQLAWCLVERLNALKLKHRLRRKRTKFCATLLTFQTTFQCLSSLTTRRRRTLSPEPPQTILLEFKPCLQAPYSPNLCPRCKRTELITRKTT